MIDNFDVTAVARKHADLLRCRARDTEVISPTTLERYMVARFVYGRRSGLWIDDLPIHVLCRASEVFGLRAVLGPDAPISGHSTEQMAACRAIGFDILQHVPLVWLEEHCITSAGRRRRHAQDLGPIHTWLSSSRLAEDFEPLRELVSGFIVNNYAVRSETVVLGRTVTVPKLIPLRYFAQRTGIPAALSRDAIAAGVAPGAPAHMGDLIALNLITDEQANSICLQAPDVISKQAAGQLLGCSFGVRDSLEFAGLLTRACAAPAPVSAWYKRSDVKRIIDAISKLPVVTRPDKSARSFLQATRLAKVSAGDVMRMLLDGLFGPACRLPGLPAISRILIASYEITQNYPVFDGTGLLRGDVARRLGVSRKSVADLIRAGFLATGTDYHPLTRMPLSTVRTDSFQAFDAEFIALVRAADEIGESFQAAIAKFEIVVLDGAVGRARFLRRDDLERLAHHLKFCRAQKTISYVTAEQLIAPMLNIRSAFGELPARAQIS